MKTRKYEVKNYGDTYEATYFENYGNGWIQLFHPDIYDLSGLRVDFEDIFSESDFEKLSNNELTKLIYEF